MGIILSEDGAYALLLEDGTPVYDEAGPPVPGPQVNPAWLAARAGLPGDTASQNLASQVAQFLAAHAITPVYAGTQIVAATGNPAGIDWISLGSLDVGQPFTLPGGATAVGRVTLPLSPAGAGADVTVSLFTDSAGSPGTLITSTTVPGAWLAQLGAPDGLAAGPVLATARANTMAFDAGVNVAWAQPAVSLNGAGNFAIPVTDGSFTILLGGEDTVANAPIAAVSVIQYLGAHAVSGPSPQPSLPQATSFGMAAVTTGSVVYAGGGNGTAVFANVWTASWAPATGTVGSWTAQAPLPQETVSGGIGTWQDTVYVVGGSVTGITATATDAVWYASAVNGQIQSWIAGPPLPQPVSNPYAAVVGGWLIVAGGRDVSGTPLTAVWYARVNADGSLGGWHAGPSLPAQGYAFVPNWNLIATDSALVIVSGTYSSVAFSPWTQALTVTADGPAPAWQRQNTYSGGEYQVGWYPNGTQGQWETFNFHLTSYDAVPLAPVPLISVPLPAAGLTSGSTYHIVVHQDGGNLNDYTQIALLPSALPVAAQTRPNSGGPWSVLPDTLSMLAGVWDQTASGPPLHLWEDSGARVTTFVYGSAAGLLIGVLEATAFPSGSPRPMMPAVTQVTWSGGQPSGLVQLA